MKYLSDECYLDCVISAIHLLKANELAITVKDKNSKENDDYKLTLERVINSLKEINETAVSIKPAKNHSSCQL